MDTFASHHRLGGIIQGWRLKRRVSIGSLAQQASVSKSTISRWESGKRVPRLHELQAVLSAMRIPQGQRLEALMLLNSRRLIPFLEDNLAGLLPPLSGELLQAMRWRLGLTQGDASSLANVPRSTLARWESGASWPNPRRLKALCAVLQPHPKELMVLGEGIFLLPQSADFDLESTEREFIAVRRLSESDPLKALTLLSLESKLWPRIRNRQSRDLLVNAYGIHSEWLESINQPTRSRDYWERMRILQESAGA
jgi:transcriptional regulator with XRE-family HTH domain